MRPADLPKPVRKRPFRESLLERSRAESSPGPARYSGYGVTNFERNTKLGTFPKDTRFKKGQLVPEDSFTKSERANAIEGDGPKYDPKFLDTRLGTSFSIASHLTRARDSGTPGPGTYTPELSWNRGVTIPNSYRRSRSANSTPGPGAYSPMKLPIRTRAPFFGSTSVSPTNVDRKDRPQLASLEAIDKSMLTTRATSPAVGFTRAERKIVIVDGETNQVGAGAYAIEHAETVTRPAVKGGKFGTSRRMPNRGPDTSGRLVALPPAELASNYTRAPAVSFGKAAIERGVPIVKEEIPTAKYNPKYSAVDSSVKGVVGWAKPRPSQSRSALVPSVTSNADFIDPTTTLDGPAISFPESKRIAQATDKTPGPGTYTPTLKVPKREPRAAGFSKSKRELVSGEMPEKTPGPIYDPDVSATRPPIVPEITIARSPRRTKLAEMTDGPDAAYDPKYAHIDKNQRSAILYLTE